MRADGRTSAKASETGNRGCGHDENRRGSAEHLKDPSRRCLPGPEARNGARATEPALAEVFRFKGLGGVAGQRSHGKRDLWRARCPYWRGCKGH